MSGGAAGEVPATAEVRAAGIQPSDEPPGIQLPVVLDEVLANITPASANQICLLEENLARRAADQNLLAELAACDFAGRRYRRFEEELAGYAMAVLCAWMYSGCISRLTTSRGFALRISDAELEELFRDSDARQDLAIMTVAFTLPRFRQHALIEGGWRYDGGASLSTYFMGACLYTFPNELRKWRTERRRQLRQNGRDPALTAPHTDSSSDPGIQIVSKLSVRDHLSRLDRRTRAIVSLTIDGYTQEEIVELLGEPSVRAVEAALYRWRKKEKGRYLGGGESSG